MQANRVIFKGKFDFGNPETAQRISRQLEPRILNLYKGDFPWKPESLLPEGADQVSFKPESMHLSDRTWKHAINGLEFLAQFALCGEIVAFDLGHPKKAAIRIRPSSEKAAVVLFNHALEAERPEEREDLLSQTLEKYPDHIDARIARAELSLDLDRLAESRADIDMALDRDREHPKAWLVSALVHVRSNQMDQALDSVNQGMSNSMPLEEVHWRCRLVKAQILLSDGQFEHAAEDFQAILTRMETRPHLLASDRTTIKQAYTSCLDQRPEGSTLQRTTRRLASTSVD